MASQDAVNDVIEQASSGTESGGLGRLFRAPGAFVRTRPRAAVVLAAAVLVFVAAAVSGWMVYRSARSPAVETGATVLEMLDQGDFVAAQELAENLIRRANAEEPPAPVGYALGVLASRKAAQAAPAARAKLYAEAARHFEAAIRNGLPETRRGEARRMQGRALLEAGEISASQMALSEAIEADPQQSAEVRQWLADAFLRDTPPKLVEALEQTKLYLAQEKLSAFQRVDALLRQAEILLKMNQPAECLQALAAIPADSARFADASVLRGRALLEQARELRRKGATDAARPQVEQKLQAAQTALREIIDSDVALVSSAARQAVYVLGLCLLETGDAAAALDRFRQLASVDGAAPERLAAAFQEGVVLETLHRDVEAAQAYCRALDLVGDPKKFHNPWVTLEQLGQRVAERVRRHRETREFPVAFELVQRAVAALPADQVLEMKAQLHRDWGRALVAQAEKTQKADPVATAALARDGRKHLRIAAKHWRQFALARLTTPFYPEEVWESACCAMEGRDYRLAVEMLREYIQVDARGRQPKALADLGEALLSLGRLDEAIEALDECLTRYSRDVLVFRARLLASQVYQEKGDPAAARRMIEANLSGEMLTPASPDYRESLFALGQLLHRTRKYEEAVMPLEELVQRDPDAPRAIEARYLIADCHRQKALIEKDRLRTDLVQKSRDARLRRIQASLGDALDWHRQTQQALLKRQQSGRLSETETLRLRNTSFFIAAELAELGRIDAAIEAYRQVVQRYPGEPETLEALVQMVHLLRAANKPVESQDALDQARFLLARFKPDAPLERTTIYNRTQWAARLEHLATSP